MSFALEIQLIAVLVSVGCALPGCFLVLRHLSMVADAITHTLLLGIVVAFFITQDLSSPLLIVGAAVVGVGTVWLTELLGNTKLVTEDAAMGIVFPLLFSIAVILISKYAGSVHLDTDMVLLGELAFAPFDRMVMGGVDVGARLAYVSGAVLVVNVAVIVLFFKELQLATFDPLLAATMGFWPVGIHYGLMLLVSLTAVASFEAVGSVLVIGFMIGPPATAYLMTHRLGVMLVLSGVLGGISAVIGVWLAYWLDVSIAGSIAVVIGMVFAVVAVVTKRR